MRQKIKKIVVPIFLSVLCGAISGKIIYSIYADSTQNILASNKLYIIEAGSYDSYDDMRTETMGLNYIYYEEDNNYNTVIAIVKDKENVEKVKKIYDKEITVKEYYLNDLKLNEQITNLDNELKNTTEDDKIRSIVVQMLDIYKKNDSIKLVKMS